MDFQVYTAICRGFKADVMVLSQRVLDATLRNPNTNKGQFYTNVYLQMPVVTKFSMIWPKVF